jgi:glutamate synthase (NADPH/NADH) small chain
VDDGKVIGVVFARTRLGEPDSQGRASAIEIPDSSFTMPCDTVVVCIGAGVDNQLTDGTGLALDSKGLIIVDERNKTNLPNVYAGGDIVTGNKIVPLAQRAGRKAAKKILEEFGIAPKKKKKEMQEIMMCISPKKQ